MLRDNRKCKKQFLQGKVTQLRTTFHKTAEIHLKQTRALSQPQKRLQNKIRVKIGTRFKGKPYKSAQTNSKYTFPYKPKLIHNHPIGDPDARKSKLLREKYNFAIY